MMDLMEFIITLGYSITLMCMLLDLEVKRKKGTKMMALVMILFLACGAFVWSSLGYKDFMILYPVFVQVPLFIAFWFFSKYKGIKLLFVLLTVIVLSSPPLLLGHIVSAIFGYNDVIVNVVCIVMYLPMTFIVYKYFRPLFLYMLRNTKKGWVTFCLIPLSYNAFTYLLGRYDVELVREEPIFWLDSLVAILIIAAYVLILRFFKQTREQFVLQNEQNILAMQVSALQERCETMKEAEENTMIYRHDLRHHLNLLNGYLAENKFAEIKKYITEIETNLEDTVTIKFCENTTVNLILSSYINKANHEKIMVEPQVYIPQGCKVSEMDLCIIMANALENAINASRNIKEINDRRISISCKYKNDKLFIQVTNNFSGEVKFAEDIPISAEENHGFGTKSIVAIVQKYSGLYSFSVEDGVFKMRVII
ncbi:GHKL domain-containing protein [Natronincola peptidivorans]|uniref:GHKL domain-containing protein n=1 Tax=Natronincola peptidivorans TaxID=426128 RepID=A0A1I0GJF8_9FIRM|nr:sensor histidine kinase [Natronincola peptidivorans]SET70171.1 GHKL domain-containing protein [Natronincola peptidivorans]